MRIDSAVSAIADFLWDVLTDERAADQLKEDPAAALTDAGFTNVTTEELDAAIDRISGRLPSEGLDRVASLRASCNLPSEFEPQPGVLSQAVGPGMAAAHAAVAPPPQIITRVVNNTQVVREQPVVNNVTNQTTQQQVNNNTSNTFVKEGDINVDNRTITEINARGDVDFDQKITNTTTVAGKGGVAANGDIKDSAINTGTNTGILAGNDVKLEDSVVGNNNTQVNDSTVGALAKNGNATNIEGKNVNTGSGDLIATDTGGGDAQLVNGNGNDVTGDVDVNAANSTGPTNVTLGDGNRSGASQDNSTNVDGSLNTDNSVSDSANTSAQDSFNSTTQNNDTTLVTVDDSLNSSAQNNDTSIFDLQQSETASGFSSDNDSLSSSSAFAGSEVDVLGSNNDVNLDFDDGI